MNDSKLLLLILSVLFIFNASPLFAISGISYLETISYILRVGLYFLLLIKIHNTNYQSEIKCSFFYKFCVYIPLGLIIAVLISFMCVGGESQIFSRIFSTFFLLADNLFFLYLGYSYMERENEAYDDIDILWYFAVSLILLMTCITVFVKIVYGDLENLWNTAREGDNVVDKFLGVYKNANPYKFAILAGFLFLRKSKYNIVLAVLCLVNILLAGKRGPLLGASFASMIIFYLSKEEKRKYIKYLLYFSFLFILYYNFIDDSVFNNLIYRMDMSQHVTRDSDTSFYMSGRDNIWTIMLEGFLNSNPISLVFGNGVLGTYNLLTSHGGPGNAHNTWLELCYNFGVIGLLIYIYYYVNLFMFCKKMRVSDFEFSNVYIYIISFSFLSTFYTVTYLGGFTAPGYANLLLCYLIGRFIAKRDSLNYL